jgi:hypothetical protein
VSAGTKACRRSSNCSNNHFSRAKRTFLCAQGFVFERLELGCDEALGVFQGLAAAVVVGHLVQLPLGDLDVEAVHLVELHAQVGDAGAGFFAGLQVEQEAVAIGLDGAQFVQLGIQPGGDHTAVAHQGGGLFEQRARQEVRAARWRGQIAGNIGQKGTIPSWNGHDVLCFL